MDSGLRGDDEPCTLFLFFRSLSPSLATVRMWHYLHSDACKSCTLTQTNSQCLKLPNESCSSQNGWQTSSDFFEGESRQASDNLTANTCGSQFSTFYPNLACNLMLSMHFARQLSATFYPFPVNHSITTIVKTNWGAESDILMCARRITG